MNAVGSGHGAAHDTVPRALAADEREARPLEEGGPRSDSECFGGRAGVPPLRPTEFLGKRSSREARGYLTPPHPALTSWDPRSTSGSVQSQSKSGSTFPRTHAAYGKWRAVLLHQTPSRAGSVSRAARWCRISGPRWRTVMLRTPGGCPQELMKVPLPRRPQDWTGYEPSGRYGRPQESLATRGVRPRLGRWRRVSTARR